MAHPFRLTERERSLPIAESAVQAVLARFGWPWFIDETPKSTPLDLWRQARIEYLDAQARHDTRGMGAALRKLKPLAHASLTGAK